MTKDTELEDIIEDEVRIYHEELIVSEDSESDTFLIRKYLDTIAEGK